MLLLSLTLLLLRSASARSLPVKGALGVCSKTLTAVNFVSHATSVWSVDDVRGRRSSRQVLTFQKHCCRDLHAPCVSSAIRERACSPILIKATNLSGGGGGPGKAAIRERDEGRLGTIQSISQTMLLLAWQGIFFGSIKLAIGLAHVTFKRKPRQFIVSDGIAIMSQLAELYISKLLRDGGLAFQSIVDRKRAEDATGICDDDVDNVMDGLESFQNIMKRKLTPTVVKSLAAVAAVLSFFSLLPDDLLDKVYHML